MSALMRADARTSLISGAMLAATGSRDRNSSHVITLAAANDTISEASAINKDQRPTETSRGWRLSVTLAADSKTLDAAETKQEVSEGLTSAHQLFVMPQKVTGESSRLICTQHPHSRASAPRGGKTEFYQEAANECCSQGSSKPDQEVIKTGEQ